MESGMMFVAINHFNERVISYLRGRLKSEELSAAPDSVADAYMGQGSHPDIVQRVWDQLGKALPVDCRCLVYGDPALVHPISGIILTFCLGTQYCLRLTPQLMEAATKLGAKTYTKWSPGHSTNATQVFGADWIFGSWKKEELDWCREVYIACSEPGLFR